MAKADVVTLTKCPRRLEDNFGRDEETLSRPEWAEPKCRIEIERLHKESADVTEWLVLRALIEEAGQRGVVITTARADIFSANLVSRAYAQIIDICNDRRRFRPIHVNLLFAEKAPLRMRILKSYQAIRREVIRTSSGGKSVEGKAVDALGKASGAALAHRDELSRARNSTDQDAEISDTTAEYFLNFLRRAGIKLPFEATLYTGLYNYLSQQCSLPEIFAVRSVR